MKKIKKEKKRNLKNILVLSLIVLVIAGIIFLALYFKKLEDKKFESISLEMIKPQNNELCVGEETIFEFKILEAQGKVNWEAFLNFELITSGISENMTFNFPFYPENPYPYTLRIILSYKGREKLFNFPIIIKNCPR